MNWTSNDRPRFKVSTAASTNALSLSTDVKPSLNINSSDTYWDTYLTNLIKGVEYEAESYMGRALITSTWDAYFDNWAMEFQIPKAPVTSITSVKYQDTDNSTQTLSTSNWTYDINSPNHAARIKILSAPSLYLDGYGAVVIRFVSGYADASSVPSLIKDAMLARIGTLYRVRQTVFVGTQVNELPLWYEKMLNPYKIEW